MSNTRHFFTPAEDQMILKWRERSPDAPWAEIAKKLKNKTAKQCNDRYNKHLKIARNDEPWSVSEDRLLKELVEEHGHNWVIVSKLLGTRSNIETKNRWSVLVRMQNSLKKKSKKVKPKKQMETPAPSVPSPTPAEPQATAEEFVFFDQAFGEIENNWFNLDQPFKAEVEDFSETFNWFV
ncbi:Myb-like DNA-binding domain containing protein [Trichomonas vaginalis G3]|uniref:Myb-like DNA-binding domain containing protein n=1 Tax=Trichomonas vaginalis (strain ATCC PRA-98 / G3) TaxID=412133 RepID=A2DLC5_TRIV3|nr:RNA polymerase II transcription regulator recruiting protein [Trichomonas vaginalis G3]EAY18743.1 Myb-like DNA-binding domain containing protein [Trichomonas vaginalis G3]KAI5539320.1 RNA polymerase II transcription regulator recruiting protein [Trichomonas vaginalis G3]|eukprot:XP_001579729.1 Myb-like DNA-binding domain containing protein [Trichomonas vaginalis G3]